MDASDLKHLCLELKRQLDDETDTISTLFGRMETLVKFSKKFDFVAMRIVSAELVLEERGGILNKHHHKVLRQGLYQLEFFLKEIGLSHVGMLPAITATSFRDCLKDISDSFSALLNVTVVDGLISKEEIIGRENEIKDIKQMLLDSHGDLSFIPILGFHGIGKTVVAQTVFHDEEVGRVFGPRHWVCMSDIKKPRQILEKYLGKNASTDLDLSKRFRSLVGGRRYLLVLDGVTQKDLGPYLKDALSTAAEGSVVIVTASNRHVVSSLSPHLRLATKSPYELRCLSNSESKTLLKSDEANGDLVNVVSNLFDKCGYVPRVIKTVAALLSYDRVADRGCLLDFVRENVEHTTKTVSSLLNMESFNQLPRMLKHCVAYCSLFPIDYKFDKTHLIHLWMAQGFTKLPAPEKKLQELVGDEYFQQLLDLGFLTKDVQTVGNDDVVTYKMHYLVNQFIKHVAIDHCYVVHDLSNRYDFKDVRHLGFTVDSPLDVLQNLSDGNTNLRSLLFLPDVSFDKFISLPNKAGFLSKLRALHTLDIASVDYEDQPSSIVEHKHLRYLRLGVSSKSLLESITKLPYLQTLDLRHSGVRVLPQEFYKLRNLRHLYTGDGLIDLPPSFGELTSLQTLDVFIVGENNGSDVLACLSGVGADGRLEVRYDRGYEKHQIKEAAEILKKYNLTDIRVAWSSLGGESSSNVVLEKDDVLLKSLQPPHTIESLTVSRWRGVAFPQWNSPFPSLTSINILGCSNCQYLPAFSALPCLKSLKLQGLESLKCVDNGDEGSNAYGDTNYFPSLEYLTLANLTELEGWSRVYSNDSDKKKHKNFSGSSKRVFPHLSILRVSGCPKLLSMPPAQTLKSIKADNIHVKLLDFLLHIPEALASSSTSPASFGLEELHISSIKELSSLSINFTSLKYLIVKQCKLLTNLVTKPGSSLERLEIYECGKLRDISSAFLNHSSVRELKVEHCEELGWGNNAAWQGLENILSLKLSMSKLMSIPDGIKSLSTLDLLSLCWLRNLKVLPKSIGSLTRLQSLEIRYCSGLTALPEELGQLSTLQQLEIQHCPIIAIAKLPNSLKRLQIRECGRLKDISSGLQCLSVLEELEIERCDGLNWGNEATWQGLKSLHSLKLNSISNIKTLPGCLECLTCLQDMSLCSLYYLKSMPDWITNLTQLRQLAIRYCPKLMELPASLRSTSTVDVVIEECPGLEKGLRISPGSFNQASYIT